jgi:hypothetical protein
LTLRRENADILNFATRGCLALLNVFPTFL